MAEPSDPNGSKKGSGAYGKRPLWQWILLYVIIAGIAYYGVYYFFIHKTSTSTGNGTTQSSPY